MEFSQVKAAIKKNNLLDEMDLDGGISTGSQNLNIENYFKVDKTDLSIWFKLNKSANWKTVYYNDLDSCEVGRPAETTIELINVEVAGVEYLLSNEQRKDLTGEIELLFG